MAKRKKDIRLESATDQLRNYFGELFDLTNERILAATRHGVSNAVNDIIKRTKANISSSWFNGDSTKSFGVPLKEGVRGFLYKGEATGVVSVMGDTVHNDGTWRLRFFEGGTKPRPSKHGKDYGSIRATNFFANVINSTDYFETIRQAVETEIDKINNR